MHAIKESAQSFRLRSFRKHVQILVFLYQSEADFLPDNGDSIIAVFQTPLSLLKTDGEIWELR
jgi:hypothetical protein